MGQPLPPSWDSRFRLLGQPLPPSRLAAMLADLAQAAVGQVELLHALIKPFLKGEALKGMFE